MSCLGSIHVRKRVSSADQDVMMLEGKGQLHTMRWAGVVPDTARRQAVDVVENAAVGTIEEVRSEHKAMVRMSCAGPHTAGGPDKECIGAETVESMHVREVADFRMSGLVARIGQLPTN